jgi:hypothetical protein
MLLLFRLGKGWKTQRLCALPKLLQQRLGIPSMKSHRENPDSAEMQDAHKQNEREIFALKMQAKQDSEYCETCGMMKSQCDCWDSVNGGN